MANAEHLKILKSGVATWNRWREENDVKPKNERVIPDLSDADLQFLGAEPTRPNFSSANLSGSNLFSVNLHQASLLGTNLTNCQLALANLSFSYMTDVNLSNANLVGSNLHGAYLKGGNLTNANLTNANLTNVNLSDTILVQTNLLGVNLSRALFANADFSNCEIGFTLFAFTDLSTCNGLESVKVGGPCAVDFYTLRASPNLPKSFLLKIGLPELYIDYLPDFFHDGGIKYYPAFLSHSWANKPFARKLYEALIARGVNVFFDEKKMKPGDDIFTGISRGIELYDKTILVCSEDSLNSWWVDQELELVFEKERKLQKEVGEKIGLLIPIRIDDAIDTWGSGKRMAIKQRIIGDFRGWEDEAVFEKALNGLIEALNADRMEIKPVSHLPKKSKL